MVMASFDPLKYSICFDKPRRLTDVSSWHEHIPFAFTIVQLLKPKVIIELGTHKGDSYCAFCQAVDNLKLNTACYAVDTWEGDEHSGLYGYEVLEELRTYHDPLYGRFSKLIKNRFDEALDYFPDRSIDLLHIDGLHSYEAVKHDFENWLPKMSRNGVILFHDTNVREREFGVWLLWKELVNKYPNFEFKHGHGLGVLAVGENVSTGVLDFLAVANKNPAVISDFFSYLGNNISSQYKLNRENVDLIKSVHDKDTQINELNGASKARELYIDELTAAVKGKESHIDELSRIIKAYDDKTAELSAALKSIQESVVWRSVMFYDRKVENLLPQNTRRRRIYDLPLNGIRKLVNKGFKDLYLNRIDHPSSKKTELIPQDEIEIPDLKKLMKYKLSYFLSQPDSELFFPEFEEPIVSIIILTFNKAEFTYQCFESILSHTEIPYELINIDNGSTDETISLLERTKNITIIKNKENLGFIKGCNQGAGIARGKSLLFLNNDTVVTPEWLSNLVNTLENYPECGAVGCKLIWPNGKLQEAGSIIWRDGSALGYGRGNDPLRPEYSYIREVDYCSGACLLVRKELFKKSGGFDERYLPAYYEDSDLCMGIRKLGYKVVFQPGIIVFHHEFTSSSFEKAKSRMEENRSRFIAKWNNELQNKFNPSPGNVLIARNLRMGNRILVLDDRIPVPDQGSGFPRAHQMLKYLGELGYNVTFFPLSNPTQWQPVTSELQQTGIEIYSGEGLDLIKFANDRMNYYDLILVSRPHNMKRHGNDLKKIFPNAVLLYDAEALFAEREILKAKVKGIRLKEGNIEHLINEEIMLMKKADVIVTVSENEKEKILQKGAARDVFVWGHPIEVKNARNGFQDRSDLLFVGGFLAGADSPNEDAILYFIKDVFPLINKELSCRLFIVGNNPTERIKKLSSSSITVTGYVENIREYYEKCKVFIVPHRFAAGISWKLQEAMSYGIPGVVSKLIASQLNLEDNNEVLIADNSDEFAEKVIKVYQNEELWSSIQNNAFENIRKSCSPEKMRKDLNEIIQKSINMRDTG